jgi:hypothetical protein
MITEDVITGEEATITTGIEMTVEIIMTGSMKTMITMPIATTETTTDVIRGVNFPDK